MNRPVSFALAAVFGATAARAAEGPIRIGQVIPITGEAAEAGRYHKYGAELAVEQVNKGGGIKGRKIELVQEDDKTTNPGAVAALQRLLEDKDIPAIIGSIRSGKGASTAPVRSISAAAAGAWLIQTASRSALTSSFVRPVLTLCG